jgi:hypothetical protein
MSLLALSLVQMQLFRISSESTDCMVQFKAKMTFYCMSCSNILFLSAVYLIYIQQREHTGKWLVKVKLGKTNNDGGSMHL